MGHPYVPPNPAVTVTHVSSWLGFALAECEYPHRWPARYVVYTVPSWFIAAISLLAPVRWAWLHRWWRRIPGRCAGCGYDLRATPDRCPECGREVGLV